MANARILKSGSYRVQAYLGRDASGKKITMSFTAPTKAEAELMASQYIAEHGRQAVMSLNVEQAIERYITAKTPVLSPPTIRAYRSYQRTHYDGIGKKAIHKLTTEDMQLFISSLAMDVSPKTVANVYGLLSSAVAFFRPDKTFHVTLPKRKKEKRLSPSDAVVRELFEKADPELKKCIALSAFGSLRRGEICALKHGDLNGTVLSVHADLVKDEAGNWVYKDIPKTSESNRTVVLPQKVIDLLGDGVDDDYIISINPGRVSDRFIKLRTRLGLNVRFHDMRHYYASIGAVIGVPDFFLSQFGGWRSDSPVMKTVYQNVISTEAEKYVNKMVSHFENVISPHESPHGLPEMP